MVGNKPTIYIVFDQLPKKKDGGLVATYVNFVNQFKEELDIKLVSVFSNGGNDIEAFDAVEIIDLSRFVLDNRFFRMFSYLKEGKIGRFFHAGASAFAFFGFIPIARLKSKKRFGDDMVVAVSPAAAIFISNKVRFILEIHTKFEYFWGNNLIGKLQSSLAAKPILTVFRNKTDAEKAKVIFESDHMYNGVEEPKPSELTEKISRKPHSALYVGGLVEHKNPFLLLRAARQVRKTIPDFTLDIYGVGELQEALQKEIEALQLKDVVTLKGFVENKAIYAQYEQFWFSSNLEGFGLVIVEAMANKTPVITTNWGDAVVEIVKDGETGFIVDSEEAFVSRSIELFEDSDEAVRIADAAYSDYRKRFSTERNKAKWKEILNRVFPNKFES